MNKLKLSQSFSFIAYALLTTIFIASISISFSSLLIKHPELAVGITFDLALTAPILYLFIIWKTKIPKTTVIPFFVVCTILASYLIPSEQQNYLNQIKTWIIPFVEIIVLSFIAISVYKTVKTYRSAKNKNSDILKVIDEVSNKVIGFPALGKIFAFEIAFIYYAFLSWRKPVWTENTFTYHKKSGKSVLFGAFIFIIGVETIVLHILIAQWNIYVAWLLTISSAYVLLQIFAHLKAFYQRPIEILGEHLYVRYGLFRGSEINLKNIETLALTSLTPNDTESVKQVSLIPDLEQFNVKIELIEECDFYGFYGRVDKFKTLLLYVDDTDRFIEKIQINDS